MDREFKPIQRFQEPSTNPSRLFESVFPSPFPAPTENSPITRDSRGRGAAVPEVPAQNSQNARINRVDPFFVPTSVDIEEFLKSESIGTGLTHKDLDRIAELALTAGKTRKQQLADYLHTRFDDVSNLSNDGLLNKIRPSDLKLYSEVLHHRETRPTGANVDMPALKKLHYDNEIKNSILPPLGFMAGVMASVPVNSGVMRIPHLAREMAALHTANPRAAATAAASLAGITLVATAFGGKEGGSMLNRWLNSGKIHTHFYDQAAPAMKRLLERQSSK